ncbi:MAG: hypothetical protein M0Z63_03855 [Actinomycetota bacterium]|nr:hypothetical protein [Actinomycetota bacterium]
MPGGLVLAVLVAVLALLSACGRAVPVAAVANPPANQPPNPDYPSFCAPAGVDVRAVCVGLALGALDQAGAAEGLPPLALPATIAAMPVAEQVFVVVDAERVARHLAPFAGMSVALDAEASRAAASAQLPADPGGQYRTADEEWIGGAVNGLDVVDEWLYDDGPGSGVQACGRSASSGCWADRKIVLATLGAGSNGSAGLVMGVGFDPTGDTTVGDRGGTSLAAVFAAAAQPGPLAYTWAAARQATVRGRLAPITRLPSGEATSGIPDPSGNVAPVPDYPRICAPSGTDSSAPCLAAVLGAVNHARALEGVRPMVLPSDFGQLPIPEQLFVAVDLERVDRGLPPFVGLTAALDADAAIGARRAQDPPIPPGPVISADTEWAGGSVNGLDAVYGWMYEDGANSGNLDCPHAGASGCWGHRHGILDVFGTVGTVAMGAAIDPTGDTNAGDRGGTSMTAVLAVMDTPPGPFVYTWAQAVAAGADGGTPTGPGPASRPGSGS